MHLWPSMRIRDSFKLAYLKKLEWNLHRMKSDKKSSTSTDQKLLDNDEVVVSEEGAGTLPRPKAHNGVLLLFKEILMVLSCCYCCFCCGGHIFLFTPFHFHVFLTYLRVVFYSCSFIFSMGFIICEFGVW